MVKRIISLSLILFILISLGGCRDTVGPENYSWVTWAGMDSLPAGKVKITLVVTPPLSPVPTGSAPPEKLMLVSSSSGDTLFEAARKINSHLPKRLFWPYLQAVIVSEDLARQGVAKHFDVLHRNIRPRKNAWVFITRGSTESIFKIDPQIEKSPAKLINSLVTAEHGFLGNSRVIRLKDFLTESEGMGIDSVVAVLGVWDQKNEQVFPPGVNIPSKSELALDGSAVFREDKLIGWLSQAESQAYLFAKGEMKSGLITVPHPDNSQNLVGIEIISSKAKLKAKMVGEQVKATIKIKVNANLGDQQLNEPARRIKAPIEEPEFYRKLGEHLEKQLKSEIDNLIIKTQTEFDSDIFGIGDYIMNRYPNDWKRIKSNWRSYYQKADIEVEVKVKIATPNIMRSHPPDSYKDEQPETGE